MGVFAILTEEPVAPAPVLGVGYYDNYYDDNYWQDGGSDAVSFYAEGNWVQTWGNDGENSDLESKLSVAGSWYTNFRTDHQLELAEVRITMEEGTSDPGLMNTDSDSEAPSNIPLAVSISIGGVVKPMLFINSGTSPTNRVWTTTDINLDPSNIEHFLFEASEGDVEEGVCYIKKIEFRYDWEDATPGGDWGTGAPVDPG